MADCGVPSVESCVTERNTESYSDNTDGARLPPFSLTPDQLKGIRGSIHYRLHAYTGT